MINFFQILDKIINTIENPIMLILVVISFIYTTDIFGCILIPLLEQKARATYEKLINLCYDDPDVLDPLRFLRQREIVHFQRFGEALNGVQEKLAQKRFYQTNNSCMQNNNNCNNTCCSN